MFSNLNDLIDYLKNNLITSEYNGLINYKKIINKYNGDDWKKFVNINNNNYNRKILFKNKILEIIIITWNTDQKSPIHGHPDGGCLLKVLKGNINEHFYSKKNKLIKNKLNTNDISYIHNDYGKHLIVNNSDEIAVTLHIYLN